MPVADILEQAGLAHLVPSFEGLSLQSFKSLLIQDYEKHGVRDMADKQALFKVIKELSAEELSFTLSPENSTTSQANSSPDPASRYAAASQRQNMLDVHDGQLVDLDADDADDDFLAEEFEAEAFSQAFMRNVIPPSSYPNNNDYEVSSTPLSSSAAQSAVHAAIPHHHNNNNHSNTSSLHSGEANGPRSSLLARMESTAASASGAAASTIAAIHHPSNNNNNNSLAHDATTMNTTTAIGGTHSPVLSATTSSQKQHENNTINNNDITNNNNNTVAAVNDEESEALAAIADPPRIRVIVRKRPLNRKELERGEQDVLECDPDNATLYVHEPKVKVDLTKFTECHPFRFDDVFDQHVDNDAVYSRAIRPLIATFFRAGKGTCFAYGQTGSGKTYTMQPLPLRAAADIFKVISAVPEFSSLSLHVACYEIYGGKVFDLLNGRQRLEVREDAKRKVQVVGLKEVEVKSTDVLVRLCEHAACARSTGSTGANDESSRSHSIMTFALRTPHVPVANGVKGRGGPPGSQRQSIIHSSASTSAAANANANGGNAASISNGPPLKTIGKLSFIDLAGSERGADTYDNDKQTRLEGAEINKSLLALKECIRALDMDAGHIPFRGSKLTSVLRDSFIGKNARTVMIANVSPSSNSCEHTLNTLRYADRVKEIKKDATNAANVANANAFVVDASAPGKNIGGGASGASINRDINEIATLLYRLPPPSMSEIQQQSSALMQQQQQQDGPAHTARNTTTTPQKESKNTPLNSPLPPVPLPPSAGINSKSAASPPKKQTDRWSEQTPGKNKTATTTTTTIMGMVSPSSAHAADTPNRQWTPASPRNALHKTPPAATAKSASVNAHPLVHSTSDASQSSPQSSSGTGANAPIPSTHNPTLLAAEEELIGAHRHHIENTMSLVREEMELLALLDDSNGQGTSIESYIEDLGCLLVEKAAAVSALQQHVNAFKRQMRNK